MEKAFAISIFITFLPLILVFIMDKIWGIKGKLINLFSSKIQYTKALYSVMIPFFIILLSVLHIMASPYRIIVPYAPILVYFYLRVKLTDEEMFQFTKDAGESIKKSKALKVVLLLFIIYFLIVSVPIKSSLSYQGYRIDDNQIVEEMEITVTGSKGLTWNFKEEFKPRTLSYNNQSYKISDDHIIFSSHGDVTSFFTMKDVGNYKNNIIEFRSLDQDNYICGYLEKVPDYKLIVLGITIYNNQ